MVQQKISYVLASALILTAGGCSAVSKHLDKKEKEPEKKVASLQVPQQHEDINTPDPMLEHMKARQQVNPASTDNSAYTTHMAPPENGEPVHFRVLKLERQMAGLQDDINRLLPPLSGVNPQLAAAVSTIKTRQEHNAMESAVLYTEPAAAAAPLSTIDKAEPLSFSPAAGFAPPASQKAAQTKPLSVAPPPPAPEKNADMPEEGPLAQTAKETPPPAKPLSAEEGDPATADSSVIGLRIGEHPGKTRIVLDLSAPAQFTPDLDNEEKLLMIALPGTAWAAENSRTIKNPLIRSWSVQKSGEGSTLAIDLGKPAKIIMSTSLPPSEDAGNRIVIDIAPL